MQTQNLTVQNSANIQFSSVNREKVTAVACITLLPMIYLVGKALMMVF